MKIINRFNDINESSRQQKAVSAINGKNLIFVQFTF